ncbi:calcineurin-like phosphoesterase family protein [Dysgonomonas alginatilytica]|uniref:Calcineurin-like phosphoesterase family protein n=1 Tax=Dysgonomonas alginatilytica TaxID=1605892 RepID=A0A2V3PHU4_9BACT|nr:metallophosphoesterase [Dysgonomonas alginatilytica]PXV58832.1 calcineurin-like phosphoesterase family protein [Dysgonomonas alginatilytica]
MPLRILHLSDIHIFTETSDQLDLDKDIRNEIELDLDKLVKDNPIDLILIGGDIAFSGKVGEYLKAGEWITSICNRIGCKEENVLLVPGNHDACWDKICPILSNAHSYIKTIENRNKLNRKIKEIITHSSAKELFMAPFRHFFDFASRYGAVPLENFFYWQTDCMLDEKKIRITGVNSALISNKYDHKENSKLVLSEFQTTLNREKDVIHLVLCHHPIDWLLDGTDAYNDLSSRASILLFGHEHESRVKMDEAKGVLNIYAGAVTPSRNEDGWIPSYNILDLNLNNNTLEIRIAAREWDIRQKKFTSSIIESELYNIPLKEEAYVKAKDEEYSKEKDVEVINVRQEDPRRKLAFFFSQMPWFKQMSIIKNIPAISLDGINKKNADYRVTKNLFNDIFERNLQKELWNLVYKENNNLGNNPY